MDEEKSPAVIEKKKMNLYQKLIEVRKEIRYIKKSAQGYKFNYATEGQLLAAIRDKMDEMSVFLEIEMLKLEPIECFILKDKQEFKLNGLKAEFEFKWTDAENPTDFIIKKMIVQDVESSIKTVGGLLTYANRYFLYKFFAVATDQADPDAFENNLGRIVDTWNPPEEKNDKQKVSQDPQRLSQEQIALMNKELNGHPEILKLILEGYKIQKIADLPITVFEGTMNRIREHKQELKKA